MSNATHSHDLDAALKAAQAQFTTQNPNSLAQNQAASKVMPGGNTRTVLYFAPFPVTITHGQDCWLWDLDGHKYLDLLGEYTAGIYGHSNPRIREAIVQALDGGINLGGHNVAEAKLAQVLCQRFPSIELVRFTNSGTEANLMALAAARAFTKRNKILAFKGGYHGGVLSFGGNVPSAPPNAPFEVVLAPYNDIAGTQAVLAEYGEQLAAIILEPMMGGGGCIPASHDFLAYLRRAANTCGSLLIFDEVMTSRLSPGGLQAVHNILPDLTTLGKYIGGGMSFGAFGGNAKVMALYDPTRPDALSHAGTFNNNVLTMNAGYTAMTEIYTPETAISFNKQGDALRTQLNELCQRDEVGMQFSGIGTMMNAHFSSDPILAPADVAKSDLRLRELFFMDMLEQGIWTARRNMINLSLPVGETESSMLVEAVGQFIERRRSVLDAHAH